MNAGNSAAMHCRELAFRSNPLFRISHIFAGDMAGKRLLPLYALFGAIEETCASSGDESVMQRKLDWWRSEAEALLNGNGTHPASVELLRSGAAEKLPREQLMALMDSAELRVASSPVRNGQDLQALCLKIGMPLLQLELSLCDGAPDDEEVLCGAAARRGIYQLVGSGGNAGDATGAWWIPMDLLARHQLARAELTEPDNIKAVHSLEADILSLPILDEPFEIGSLFDISDIKHMVKNLAIYDALILRKRNYTNKSSYIIGSRSWGRIGVGDVIACWRAARRVSLLK